MNFLKTVSGLGLANHPWKGQLFVKNLLLLKNWRPIKTTIFFSLFTRVPLLIWRVSMLPYTKHTIPYFSRRQDAAMC